jgi:hypothetical protein
VQAVSTDEQTADMSAEQRGEAAELRAYQQGHTKKDPVVDEFVGQVQRADLGLFQALSEAYRSEGEAFGETELYDRMLRCSANYNVDTALRNDRLRVIQNVVGKTGNRTDASGLYLLNRLRSWVSEPSYVCYIYGRTGTGKTDFALLLYQIWQSVRSEQGYDTDAASNITSWDSSQDVETWQQLQDWLGEAGHDNTQRLFVFDEASSHASGYAGQQQDARKLGTLVNLMRKYRCSLIIIGHTGRDVHPDVLRKARHTVHKTSQKQADFLTKKVDADGNMDNITEAELKRIPPTSEDFATDEASDWDWGSDDRQEHAAELREVHDLPVNSERVVDLTDIFDVSARTVYRWLSDDDDGDS